MKYKAVFAYLVVLIGFLLSFQTTAKEKEFAIPADFHGYVDAQYIQYIEQPDAMYTDTQILSGIKNGWQQLPANPKFKNDVTYWFKLRLSAAAHAHWILSPGFWHQSKIYYSVDHRNWNSVDTSVFQPLSKRQVKAHLPLVRLEVPAQGMDVFIKVAGFRHGREADAQYVQILDEIKFLNQQAEEQRVQGGYMGFAIGLAGFHLVLWFWFRERTYLWLVVAMSASPLFFHAFLGFGLTNLWPSFPVWNEYSASLLAALVPALYLRFGESFLNLRAHIKVAHKAVKYVFYAVLVSSVAVFHQGANWLFVQSILTLIGALILLVSSIHLGLKGYRYAWFFVAGSSMLMVSLFTWPFIELGNIKISELPISIVNFTQFACAWQGILLALGMAEQMQSMQQIMLRQELASEKQAVKHAQQTRALIQAQNQELESSNRALKELDDLKDEFLARTSHELNTPLNGIIGLSQILLDKEVDLKEDERQEYLELIASRGEHLKELVFELLEFVKTRKEVINLYKEPIDIASHINKIVLTFMPQAESKGLYLENVESVPVIINADPRRIRQVATILLDNALKYTDEGGVAVSLEHTNGDINIHIKDTGIGIGEEHLNTIFEPFIQLKRNDRTREGAGLGLSICKHLIELHGGKMSIESKVGKGSTFTIRLPKK